jgi:hypothetical protein
MTAPDTHCAHGKPFFGDSRDTQCIECDIVWHSAMLDAANERADHHRRMLEIAGRLRDMLLSGSR